MDESTVCEVKRERERQRETETKRERERERERETKGNYKVSMILTLFV